MNTNFELENIIKILLAIMFFSCLLDWEYGYFQLVRFLGMVGFAFLAYNANLRKDTSFTILWAASAILINPLIKISLGRQIWMVIDVIWAVLLLYSIYHQKTNK